MTESTHDYTLTLVSGGDEYPLTMRGGGTVTLDDKSAPHVEVVIDIAIPTDTALAQLDPRLDARVRIDVAASFPFGDQTRSFDLGLRTVTMDHRDGIATLTLASDEALLIDWAQFSDDIYLYGPRDLETIVNYVLGQAIPGTTVTPGGPNPPFHSLIASTNLVRNPRAKLDLTDWSSGNSISRQTSGGPDGCPTYVNVQSASAGMLLVNYSADGVPIEAGKVYRISVYQNVNAGTATAIDGLVLSAAGSTLLDIPEVSQIAPAGWFRRKILFTAPAGAAKLQLRSFTTVSVAAGQSLNTTGWRVSEVTPDEYDDGYFDGDTTDTDEYAYAYSGNVSIRTPLIDRAPDVHTWKAGVNGLDFLAPILQSQGIRLVCDDNRVWTLRDSSYLAPGSLTIREGVNLGDGEDVISREDTEHFDAATATYRWKDADGVWQERHDAFFIVFPYTKHRLFEFSTPYPGPGFAEYAVRRAQGRGRQVTVRAVSDWRAVAEQASEYVLDGSPIQVGKSSRIVFDLSGNAMTVTSRTTDALPDAIDLLDGTIDALVGTIDSL